LAGWIAALVDGLHAPRAEDSKFIESPTRALSLHYGRRDGLQISNVMDNPVSLVDPHPGGNHRDGDYAERCHR
jgi:hypothetical protein